MEDQERTQRTEGTQSTRGDSENSESTESIPSIPSIGSITPEDQERTQGTKRTQSTGGHPENSESAPSIPSVRSIAPTTVLPPHGGYRNLLSFKRAQVVYDATIYFCRRFLSKRDRTYDQMVQAARSGKQNIAEGSQISGTSKELELNLTNVARASLEELLTDYRDFLRTRGLPEWDASHPYALRLRALNRQPGSDYETFRPGIEHPEPMICANVIIGLVKVTTYLLDRQIRQLEREFLQHGGMRERMATARRTVREEQRRQG